MRHDTFKWSDDPQDEMPPVTRPALWELGAEIYVRIVDGELVISNGIDILWSDEERSWGV